MKLYYTGGKVFLDEQTKPYLSLGNFVSSSPVPNGFLDNMFGDISELGISRNLFEVIGIVLKNELVGAVEDIYLWFDYPENVWTKLEIAAVQISGDATVGYSIEKIINLHALPINAVFYEADGEGNKVNLGNLAAGVYLGLWFKRTLLIDKIEEDTDTDKLYENFENSVTVETKDDIVMKIDWTVP